MLEGSCAAIAGAYYFAMRNFKNFVLIVEGITDVPHSSCLPPSAWLLAYPWPSLHYCLCSWAMHLSAMRNFEGEKKKKSPLFPA